MCIFLLLLTATAKELRFKEERNMPELYIKAKLTQHDIPNKYIVATEIKTNGKIARIKFIDEKGNTKYLLTANKEMVDYAK